MQMQMQMPDRRFIYVACSSDQTRNTVLPRFSCGIFSDLYLSKNNVKAIRGVNFEYLHHTPGHLHATKVNKTRQACFPAYS